MADLELRVTPDAMVSDDVRAANTTASRPRADRTNWDGRVRWQTMTTAVLRDPPAVQPGQEDRPSLWGWTLGLWILGTVGLAVPLIMIQYRSASISGYAVLGHWACMAYGALRLAQLTAHGKPRPMATLAWIFVTVWLGMAPLAQVLTGIGPVLIATGLDRMTAASVVILVGAVGYDAGYWLRGKRGERAEVEPRGLKLPRLTALSIIGLLSVPIYLTKFGGLVNQFRSRQSVLDAAAQGGLISDGTKAGSAIYQSLGTVPVFVALLSWTIVITSRDRAGLTSLTGARALWFALLIANAVVNNPISNARNWFGTILVAFVFAMGSVSASRFRAVLATALIIAAVVFPYADYFRVDAPYRKTVSGSVMEVMSAKDYDATAQVSNAISFSDQRGHTYGQQILGAALFAVPRSVWETKPYDTGIVLAKFVRSRNLNLSAPLWAEAYVDFGIPGVLVILFLVGYSSRWADDRYLRARISNEPLQLAQIAVPIAAGYSLIVLRGSLLQSMGRAAVLLLVLWWIAPRLRGQAHGPRLERSDGHS